MKCNWSDCNNETSVRFEVLDKNTFKAIESDKQHKCYCLEHDEEYAKFLRTLGYLFIRYFRTDKW